MDGKGTVKITQADRARIDALGVIKEQKSLTEETLDILEALQAEGIAVTKIQKNRIVDGKNRRTYLYEIQHENIEEIIKKLGLDREFPLGFKMSKMLQAYKGTGTGKVTQADRARIEALGLVSELKKKEAEQGRLKKKQEETQKLKTQVKQELDKQNDNKDLGDVDE